MSLPAHNPVFMPPGQTIRFLIQDAVRARSGNSGRTLVDLPARLRDGFVLADLVALVDAIVIMVWMPGCGGSPR